MQSIFDLVEEAVESITDSVKDVVPVVAGGGVPVAVMALAGDVDVSVMGFTARLTTLGTGSVLGGMVAAILIGVGSYFGTKKLIKR